MIDPMTSAMALPGHEEVLAAATRIRGHVRRTPMLQHPMLDEAAGGQVFLKPESLQHTGAYKLRGAFNVLLQLDPAARAAGVIAPSSGNFGQAVSWAAGKLGIPALVVMPQDAPAIKIESTRRWGAEVVLFDRQQTDRAELVETFRQARGAQVISAFDHPHVIAGQGTAALELIEDAALAGVELAHLVAPIGGGGLMAGCALAAKGRNADAGTQVWGVQPEGWAHTRLSLAAGERVQIPPGMSRLCDALMSLMPGVNTFAINRVHLAGVETVDETEILGAIRFAFEQLKLVLEPAGAVGLAWLLTGRLALHGQSAGVILSGGNADPRVVTRALLTERAHG